MRRFWNWGKCTRFPFGSDAGKRPLGAPEARRAKARAKRAMHRADVCAKARAYYAKKRDHFKNYRAKNKEIQTRQRRAWALRNPGVMAAIRFKRIAAEHQAMPRWADLAAMKAEYKRPKVEPIKDQAMVELGRQLFWDPRLSASGKTACVTCHLPYLGYGVTDRNSRLDSGKFSGIFKAVPDRSDLPADINEALIVELYSK